LARHDEITISFIKTKNAKVAQLVEHDLAPKKQHVSTLARHDEITISFTKTKIAKVAQLVEHDLAKVGVAGSSPVFRSLLNTVYHARMVEW
jgi:hypothetical protein